MSGKSTQVTSYNLNTLVNTRSINVGKQIIMIYLAFNIDK